MFVIIIKRDYNLIAMKIYTLLTLFLTTLMVSLPQSMAAADALPSRVVTYSAPQGAPMKDDYSVSVKSKDANDWQNVPTYMARVNAPLGKTEHKISELSYGIFDFTGAVTVKVVCKKGKTYKHVKIRPNSKGITATEVNDSTVTFELTQPENVSVEFDGDIRENLLLFTSAPLPTAKEMKKEARKQGRQFKYYAPGLYKEEKIKVESNTTVYIEGGAYFTGTFAIEDARDVTITGRGIARPESGYEGCHVHRSKNVVIEGLTLNTCPVGGSDGVVLRDVHSVSHPGWGDGLNIFASSNVLFERVFCRNSDDCTTAYATRKGFSGSVRNITMKNSTLWADVAHPIFIGLHGNPEVGDSIVGLRYENIDILGQSEFQIDYQGCLAINVGDDNYVKNVLFDDIRIENINNGCLVQVKVAYNQKYCTAPGRGVENVTFRNVKYDGEMPNISLIAGYDEQRTVKNITFDGLVINGKKIYDDMPGKKKWYSTADFVPMYVGTHVSGVTFK